MKIATWNVNSLRVRLPHVLSWLHTAKPDILCLQETKMKDENFPISDFQNAGYGVSFSGQKGGFNGVAILHRFLSDTASVKQKEPGTQKNVSYQKRSSLPVATTTISSSCASQHVKEISVDQVGLSVEQKRVIAVAYSCCISSPGIKKQRKKKNDDDDDILSSSRQKDKKAATKTEKDGVVSTPSTSCFPLRVINVYVPNGQDVTSPKYQEKLDWLRRLKCYIDEELEKYEYLILTGDFNIAPESRDVRYPQLREGKLLCSEKERAAFFHFLQTSSQGRDHHDSLPSDPCLGKERKGKGGKEDVQKKLKPSSSSSSSTSYCSSTGLVDVFRQFDQPQHSFSWWDYRIDSFSQNDGLRLDLILASQSLSEICVGCRIDTEPRGWHRPSDHTPVEAVFSASFCGAT